MDKPKTNRRREYLVKKFSTTDASVSRLFQACGSDRRRISEHMCESIKKLKTRTKSVEPPCPLPKPRATIAEFREIVEKSPYIEMSRFLERDIREKIRATDLQEKYQTLTSDMMKEVKEEFVKITHYAGTNLKIKSCHPELKFQIEPYKFVGKTENYGQFLQTRHSFQSKWILHYPIIGKIHRYCVANLPYELVEVDLPRLADLGSLRTTLKEKVQTASQLVYDFHQTLLTIVNTEEAKMKSRLNQKEYLGACTGLVSLHISRSIAHTLLSIVKYTGHQTVQFLRLNVAFDKTLVLTPVADRIVDIFHDFLDRIVEVGKEMYAMERYKIRGYENKCIRLCLTEEFVAKCKNDLKDNIEEHYAPISEYLRELSGRFCEIYGDVDSKEFLRSISNIDFSEGCRRIKYYQEYLHKVMFVPDHEFFRIGKMSLIDYREELHRGLKFNVDAIFQNLCSQHYREVNDLCETFSTVRTRANRKPETTEELIETGRYMSWIRNEQLEVLTTRVHESLASLCKIIDLGILTEEHMTTSADAIHWLDHIWPIIDEHLVNFDQLKFEAEERLQKVVEDANVVIKDVYPILVILDEMDDISRVREYLHSITLQMMKIKEIEKEIDWINKEEVILSFPKSTYSEYEDLKGYVHPFYHLLKLCLDVQRNLSVWQDGPFDRLSYEATRSTVDRFQAELDGTYKAYRKKLRQAQDENLPLKFRGTVDDPDILNWPAPLKLCGVATRSMGEFKPSVEVMRIICNPCLRKRHWVAMSQIAGTDVEPNAGTTLRKMMLYDFLARLEEYEIISTGATKEEQLRKHLNELEDEWKEIRFEFVDDKHLKLLTQLEEIDSTVNDHAIEIKNMIFSVFVKPHEKSVSRFNKQLQKVKSTVENWSEAQVRLSKLIPIFVVGDLSQAMPVEAKTFHDAYSIYNSLVILTTNEPIIKMVSTTDVTEKIRICLVFLERVHEGVVNYLETVREYFPRFYFLSNTELLEALSDPTHIYHSHTFLQKIFPGILRLDIDTENINGLYNSTMEAFHFTNPIKIVLMPLQELSSRIEREMRTTLRHQLVECYKGYKRKKLRDLLRRYPVQVLLAVSQIYFTETVTATFGLKHNIKLRLQMQKLNENISEKIDRVNDATTNYEKEKLKVLIINDVNNRNLLLEILEGNKIDHQNFKWQAHFKHYYKDQTCHIKALDTSITYKYEYVGNLEPIVHTPITEKCTITLMNAYRFHFCGLLRGEAGTQKIETFRYIATSLGILFMYFHYSQHFTLPSLKRILKGNSMCQSWVCLNNFTRLEPGILSVISQDLLDIRNKKVCSNIENTSFLCASIKLERFSDVLPDTIKVQFRTVTLLRPDIERVAEGMLLASGFVQAKILAKKIHLVFKLCDDFFVKLDSYFGIGKLNEVLKYCEEYKGQGCEGSVVCYAIRSTICSAVPINDRNTLDGILRDVFPNSIPITLNPNDAVNHIINNLCKEKNVQLSQNITNKIIEVYECLKRDFKVLLLGETWSGKTTLLTICKDLMAQLKSKTVRLHFINPSYLNFRQLYGFFEKHWTDGIVTRLIREFCSNSEEDNWMVFDGKLGKWVEHLIPMLHEGKLYLESGEVLIVPQGIGTVFEVASAGEISPTMLSRCSVIYLDEDTVDWSLLLKSWLDCCPSDWIKEHRTQIHDIFHWLIPPCLSFIKHHCSVIIRLNGKSSIRNIFLLFQAILDDVFSKINKKEEDPRNFPAWIQAALIQSGMLTMTSLLDYHSSHIFDEFYKSLWKGQNLDHPYPESLEKLEVSLPNEGYLYDYQYVYRQRGAWKMYHDLLKTEKILESRYMTQFLVPTVDALRNNFLLNIFVKYKRPFLLVGPAGSGKTLLIEDTLINKLAETEYDTCHLNVDIHLRPKVLQEFILGKLNKGKKGVFSPTPRKDFLMFIDNVNLTYCNENGDLTCLELLRQQLDHKTLYSYENFNEIIMERVNIVAAAGLVEGSRKELCQRFLRHFLVFGTSAFTDDTTTRIFSNSLLHVWRKRGFPSDITSIVHMVTDATLHVFKEVRRQCKPTLSRCHYVFNIDSFAKVIQGCALLKKETYDGNKKIYLKLWAHETYRVFGDRLSSLDNGWLLGKIRECFGKFFGESHEDSFENEDDMARLLFGTDNENSKRYEEISDLKHLTDVIAESYLKYNAQHDIKLSLTLFQYAVDKLVKICRILSLSPSNALLLGRSGTGKQSLTKLAAFMNDQRLFHPEITRDYDLSTWNDYIKLVAKEAGALETPCVLLLSEEQILQETFLLSIDQLLRNGEIPGLYDSDERQEILELARLSAQGGNENVDISSRCVFLHFNKRCKENLHLILCLSPSEDKLRRRLSDYPGLTTCHVMLWEDWPDESYTSIGRAYTLNLKLDEEIKESLVSCGVYFHRHSQNVCKQNELKGGFSNPVTSTYFVRFMELTTDIIVEKERNFLAKIGTYRHGLSKLSYASTQISNMQKALAEYQPQLEAMTLKASEMTDQIALETIEVEKASALVRKDEKIASEQAIVAQRLKSECESELAQAIPILEDAISALNTLKPSDITLVKSMKNPPDAIKLVMAAVCVIKDVKPDRLPDPSTGRKILDYWSPSKRILGDMNFLQTLKDFDKDHIKPEIMVKIRKEYLPHKDFKPHVVAKASSAAEGLCKWIIAMDMYDKVAKEVAPKKEKLEKAEREYATTMEVLNQKKEEVTRIEAKLAGLHALLEDAMAKQLKLQQEVDMCNKKLNSAKKLIGSLGGEKLRWVGAVTNLELQGRLLPGNSLLSAGFVSYLSCAEKVQRIETLSHWRELVATTPHLNCSEDFSIIKSLSSEEQTDLFLKNGVPHDDYFLENAVINFTSKTHSIFIDPEYEAKTWICNIEKSNHLTLTKFTEQDHFEKITSCIVTGKPVLVHEVKHSIPHFLYPLIKKQYFTSNHHSHVTLDTKTYQIDPSFRLYLVSNLHSPHLKTEITKRVTLIKFSLTISALEDKLLNVVTEIEKPELRKLRKELYKKKRKNRQELTDLETKILKTLCESDADILEDEASIKILDESKDLARIVREKQEESKKIEALIEDFRKHYVDISGYSANLYFCVLKLKALDCTYECSVNFFTDLYYKSIMQSPRSKDVDKRGENIVRIFTYSLYCYVSWFIKERHHWVFLLLLALSILSYKKIVTKEEVVFFLKAHDGVTTTPNPAAAWLTNEIWANVTKLQELPLFENFLSDFTSNVTYWRDALSNEESFWNLPRPETIFQKLILLKLFKPNNLYHHLKTFISKQLGDTFLTRPQLHLSQIYNESHNLSPILFLTSPSSNILDEVACLAKKKKVHHLFRYLCFGEGKEDLALSLMDSAQEKGSWLLFENCHLCPNWFRILQRKLAGMDFDNTHENFRLYLTSEAGEVIPLELLQNSLKVLDDDPRGLKERVRRFYSREPISDAEFFNSCPGKQTIFTKLLFGLCLYHCTLLERQAITAWKTPYFYDEADFKVSIRQLSAEVAGTDFNQDYYEKIFYILSECHYGGYLEDPWDLRLIKAILMDFVNPNVVAAKNFLFNNVERCGLPKKFDYQDYINHISNLPEEDDCNVYSLDGNTYENATCSFFKQSQSSVLSTYEYQSPKDVYSNEFFFITLTDDLLKNLQASIVREDLMEDYVIRREIESYNHLVKVIKENVGVLKDSISGNLVISQSVMETALDILQGVIPREWRRKCYPTRTTFAGFIKDLNQRIEFFNHFNRQEKLYWLGAFFFPKSLICQSKLQLCKSLGVPVDEFKYSYEISPDSNDGCIFHGLYITGAQWNNKIECVAKSTFTKFPPIKLIQRQFTEGSNFYECPLFQTSNFEHFVEIVRLPTDLNDQICIKRNVKLVCQSGDL